MSNCPLKTLFFCSIASSVCVASGQRSHCKSEQKISKTAKVLKILGGLAGAGLLIFGIVKLAKKIGSFKYKITLQDLSASECAYRECLSCDQEFDRCLIEEKFHTEALRHKIGQHSRGGEVLSVEEIEPQTKLITAANKRTLAAMVKRSDASLGIILARYKVQSS